MSVTFMSISSLPVCVCHAFLGSGTGIFDIVVGNIVTMNVHANCT